MTLVSQEPFSINSARNAPPCTAFKACPSSCTQRQPRDRSSTRGYGREDTQSHARCGRRFPSEAAAPAHCGAAGALRPSTGCGELPWAWSVPAAGCCGWFVPLGSSYSECILFLFYFAPPWLPPAVLAAIIYPLTPPKAPLRSGFQKLLGPLCELPLDWLAGHC